ncbi:hypothetical protein PG994_002580 [Apiospora phragmitis]|uniref:Uncharacterized protein n=1 Tax=Apiospora phragmitis TaxID=2905665 RepID=A0ABR1W5P3_9PEZI
MPHYWELRAFHHFTVATSATLPGTHIPEVKDCFAVQVPILALSHAPLWSEMVALGALHLLETAASSTPPEGKEEEEDPKGLLACREAALEAALRTYRPVLGELGPHNADAAGFTAILLLIDAFATLRMADQGRRTPSAAPITAVGGDDCRGDGDDVYAPPMHWLRIARGARVVLKTALTLASTAAPPRRQRDDDGETGIKATNNAMSILTIIESYPRVHYDPATASATLREGPPELHADTDNNCLTHLMIPLPGEPKQSTEVIVAYAGAVQQLNLIQTAIAAAATAGKEKDGQKGVEKGKGKEDVRFLCRGMMAFPCLVPPLFLDLVERREPRALVILAHFFAFMTRVRALWWVGDTPVREVRAICRALGSRYHRLMRVPLELVERWHDATT